MSTQFILFGAPRSGTTLLAQCLSAHSQVFVPYETDVIGPCALIIDRVRDAEHGKPLITGFILHSYFFKASLGQHLTPEEVRHSVASSEYTLQAIFRGLYAALGAKVGKPITGDKSPFDLFNLFAIERQGLLEEPVKVIHLVRNMFDVLASLHRQAGWLPRAEIYFPRRWSDRNLFLQSFLREAPNYFFLRYEDFVADPGPWAAALCEFLGCRFEPAMLGTSRFHERYRLMPAHARRYGPIGEDRVQTGRSGLPPEQVAAVQTQAHEALVKFGYLG